MFRRLVVASVIVLAARAATACSMALWAPDALLENPVISSASGRYLAVQREYDRLPDFATKYAREVYPESFVEAAPPELDIAESDSDVVVHDYVPPTMTVALYERQTAPRLLAEIKADARASLILVSDGGRVVAINAISRGCASSASSAEDPLIYIYSSDGSRLGVLTIADVFSTSDVWPVLNDRIEYTLRKESDTRELLVLTVNGVERRIDLATAALLDPKTDIFPRPRVYAVAATDFVAKEPFLAPSADCEAAFAAHDLVRLEPDRFYRRAVLATLPPFPEVMRKARIRGTVLADLVVSEQGVVECVRVTPLLFATDAVIAAAKNWRFDALMIDGRRVKFAGEMLFRFDDPDDAAWRDYVAMAPPLVESP